MRYPAPRRSKFNPFVQEADKDYSNVDPLFENGSNFPCKSYAPDRAVATFSPGDTIPVVMSGSVFHQGGHCQFSLSYDDQNFVVLGEYMKNCFVGTGLQFNIKLPETTPPCDRCTLAWSWVNAVGNREFYMNCADIRIFPGAQSQSFLAGKRNRSASG